MQSSGERLIWGVEKHFFFMMVFLLGWMTILCLPGVAVPIGNYWWDYLVVKGLEYQFFDVEGSWRDDWLPMLLPVILLRLAHVMSEYGVDYFLAHALIALPTMFFGYHAVYLRISSSWRVPAFWMLLLFSIFPVIVDFSLLKSFRDANAVAYAGFYNRYLDVIFCLALMSVVVWLRGGGVSGRRWLVAFWCYALLVALLSKLTYFIVLWGVLWSFAILRRQYRAAFPCGFAAVIACLLAIFLPNYFSTNWDVATVRSISFSAWHLPLLVMAGLAASWILGRQEQKCKTVIFLVVPLAASWGIGLGNYGDLAMLRYAVAVAVTLWLLGEVMGGAKVSVGFHTGEGLSKRVGLDERAIILVVTSFLLLYPVAVLLKTTGVTTFAMAARVVLPAGSFIHYPNLPGFFSHERFITKRFSVSHIDRVRVLPLVKKRRGMKHTATFFTLYAIDLDRAIGKFRVHADSTVTWVSFPALSSQVFGVGRMPVGARPWYLWGHEIGRDVRPNYDAIKANSDLMVVDRCNWGPGSAIFRELFGVADYEQREAIFDTVCFRAIRGRKGGLAAGFSAALPM